MNINDERKLVTIWLKSDEKDDPEFTKNLKPIYRQFGDKKYTVCVFKSGGEDLAENTSALLRYNRKKQAEREIQEEKEISMTI